MMTHGKIRGGYREYVRVLREGHENSSCHNPAVFYNAQTGFYIAPDRVLIPNADFRVCACNLSANTGRYYEVSGSRSEYCRLRRAILRGDEETVWNLTPDACGCSACRRDPDNQ